MKKFIFTIGSFFIMFMFPSQAVDLNKDKYLMNVDQNISFTEISFQFTNKYPLRNYDLSEGSYCGFGVSGNEERRIKMLDKYSINNIKCTNFYEEKRHPLHNRVFSAQVHIASSNPLNIFRDYYYITVGCLVPKELARDCSEVRISHLNKLIRGKYKTPVQIIFND